MSEHFTVMEMHLVITTIESIKGKTFTIKTCNQDITDTIVVLYCIVPLPTATLTLSLSLFVYNMYACFDNQLYRSSAVFMFSPCA